MKSGESGELFLQHAALIIEQGLEQALPAADEYSRPLHEAMRYALFPGGKRLRPLMVLSAARAVHGNPEAALPGAVAIELIHTYSLIHDDLPAMDNDDYRRGRPTVHRVAGEAMAILAGDGLLTLAFEVLGRAAEAGVPPERVAVAVSVLARAAGPAGMVAGQAADIDQTAPATMDRLRYLHSQKTAALFEAAAMLGPVLSGSPGGMVELLRQFGRSFGLAYQIIDDLEDQKQDAGRSAVSTYPGLAGPQAAAEEARRYCDQATVIASRLPAGDGLVALVGMVQSHLDMPVH